MGWCDHCQDDCDFGKEPGTNCTYCTGCGKVVAYDEYTDVTTFEKTSSGHTRLAGTIFNNETGFSASRERTLYKGRDEIERGVTYLEIGGGMSIVNEAHRFYQIAVDKGFTKGRRTPQVASSCLYLACRATSVPKPYLLIDFSDYLKINVYVLGAVFLQLCKMLRLEEHPFVQKIIDPSLFIHRYTERLLGGQTRQRLLRNQVSDTALRIVAGMKRDWIQTGRKPSGLCGAAIYISSLSHGLDYSKSDIVSVVHICEATLTKRLVEFENTESGGLTIDEFLRRADEHRESDLHRLPVPGKVLCLHKENKVPHFANGLCKECHDEFIEISGGVEGGAEPPAFQRAERHRLEKEKELPRELSHANVELLTDEIAVGSSCKIASDSTRTESMVTPEPESIGPFGGQQSDHTFSSSQSKDGEDPAVDDRESLSDIDDDEVGGYLHNEEEKVLKEIAWTEMNREYLEEQAAKEAAAAEGLPKVKKERKRRVDDKNSIPADSPLNATRQILDKKKLSSRINPEALKALYNTDEGGNTKKQRTESDICQSEGTVQEHDNAQDKGFEEVDYGGDYGDGEGYSFYQDGTVDF